jgi:hypothetical protein
MLDLSDIPILCQGDQISVGDWRNHDGCLYVACTNIDCAIPFPDSRDWEGPYDIKDVLNSALKPCGSPSRELSLPVWENCAQGDHCVTIYPDKACVWSYDDIVKQYKIYVSLKSDNHDRPFDGANKTPRTWEGGYSACDLIQKILNPCNELLDTPDNGNYIGG